jgi:hypothetical protein
MLPVNTGGHDITSHFVPALFPPQRKMVNSRLPTMTALFFGCDTPQN